MRSDLEERCRALLTELGLTTPGSKITAHGLLGGVSSDIAVVTVGDRKVCAKFALPTLKVEADWSAPVHRNAAEYAWLEFAAEVAPASAVKLYGRSEALHGFAMEYIEGKDIYLWKSALLEQAHPEGEAGRVGDLLGRIHAVSAEPGFNASQFQNRDDFHALRIEPYLLHTSKQYPDLVPQLEALASQLYQANEVLVHGDVSPKNILFRHGNAIVLDAECATMGDASFDPSFCLNHIVLKAIHLPSSRSRNLHAVVRFWEAYSAHVTWVPVAELEARICRLLPALMLARVDGKSPVEYLSDQERQTVRQISQPLIVKPTAKLEDFTNAMEIALREAAA